jgi:hypothetical protein
MDAPAFDAIDVPDQGLHLKLFHGYLDAQGSASWWSTLTKNASWHRVMYKSKRFGKQCETPCYTSFYGGFDSFAPYVPIPAWLQPLVDRVSSELGTDFNAILLRLYFDGADEIAWHTDGRTFLGDEPTIGSLSLGATAHFQMRRMRNVWPTPGGGDDGVDHATPPRDFAPAHQHQFQVHPAGHARRRARPADLLQVHGARRRRARRGGPQLRRYSTQKGIATGDFCGAAIDDIDTGTSIGECGWGADAHGLCRARHRSRARATHASVDAAAAATAAATVTPLPIWSACGAHLAPTRFGE